MLVRKIIIVIVFIVATLVCSQKTYSRTDIVNEVPAQNTTPSIDIIARGVVDCSTYCFESSDCACLFYSTTTGRCRGYSQHAVNNATFVPESNVIHFDTGQYKQSSFISRQECEANGYIYSIYPRLCIKIDQKVNADWDSSRQACQTDNADLVILDSDDKISYVSNYIQTNRSFNRWLIGLRMLNGVWKWLDSTTLDATKTPNLVTNQTCAILNADKKKFGSINCNEIKRYICEKR